ncbi:MAG: hypothetical protein ACRDPT_16450 [Streptomycetales bacterium]
MTTTPTRRRAQVSSRLPCRPCAGTGLVEELLYTGQRTDRRRVGAASRICAGCNGDGHPR